MEFASLELASNPNFYDKPIDILIGSDWQFITGNVIRSNTNLAAVESKFGWILSGASERAASGVDVSPNTALSKLIIEREIGSCNENDDLSTILENRNYWHQ
jgi:chemotaxis regulatin CheY-phosphate phosphatase CheZ